MTIHTIDIESAYVRWRGGATSAESRHRLHEEFHDWLDAHVDKVLAMRLESAPKPPEAMPLHRIEAIAAHAQWVTDPTTPATEALKGAFLSVEAYVPELIAEVKRLRAQEILDTP